MTFEEQPQKYKLEPAINQELILGQRKTSKDVTSMGWQLSPRYGHVILVGGYPVLTAVS